MSDITLPRTSPYERITRIRATNPEEIALAAARRAMINPDEVWTSAYGAVELIEAAARTGATATAAAQLERLTVATQASGTSFALGMEARCRALLAEGEAADRLYREAIDALGRTRVRVELARSQLLYGEWLRRARRPSSLSRHRRRRSCRPGCDRCASFHRG